jgi:hypothetical protein
MNNRFDIISKLKNITIILLLMISLVGCKSTPLVQTKIQDPIVLHPPKPDTLQLRSVEWEVWNAERLREEAGKVSSEDMTSSWVVTDLQSFRNYVYNLEQIENYIERQNIILLYYRALFPPQDTENE